jgi:hypothetical protein
VIRADKYVRLAADQPSQSGWIFSRIPLTANNWEIEMEFSIAGKGNLHGDGFALWVTKDRAKPGNVFGHTDRFEGLGLFFDTYKNNRPGVVFPYVMAMIGDGNTVYDRANDGKANELGGCSVCGWTTSTSTGRMANMVFSTIGSWTTRFLGPLQSTTDLHQRRESLAGAAIQDRGHMDKML